MATRVPCACGLETGMARRLHAFLSDNTTMLGWPAMGETTPEQDPRKLAEEARDRVRFEEEALDLSDQVYRVARRLVSTREEAEDLSGPLPPHGWRPVAAPRGRPGRRGRAPPPRTAPGRAPLRRASSDPAREWSR